MPTEAEEAAERIASRLHDRKPSDSIPLLLLQILAEELRIHRQHMQERAKQSKSEPNKQDQDKHGRHLRLRKPSSPRTEDPHKMMSGGSGPSGTQGSDHQPKKSHRGRRGKRTPPLGPVPTYRPKLGLTLGLVSHIKACKDHEAERKAKEKRKKERRARGTLAERREAKKKGKFGSEPSNHPGPRREARGHPTHQEPRRPGSAPGPGASHDAGPSSHGEHEQPGSRRGPRGGLESDHSDLEDYERRASRRTRPRGGAGAEYPSRGGYGQRERGFVYEPSLHSDEEGAHETDQAVHGSHLSAHNQGERDRRPYSGSGAGEASWGFGNLPRDG